MEPTLIIAIIGLSTLVVERLFAHLSKIKKSRCCGNTEIEMSSESEKK